MNMNMMSGPAHHGGPPPFTVGSPPTMVGSAPNAALVGNHSMGSAPPMMVGSAPNLGNEMMRHPPPTNLNPPEYLHQHQHQHQHQQQHPPPSAIPPTTSMPWTVGSTDGTFATMSLMQEQQQQQQHKGAPWTTTGVPGESPTEGSGAGVAIGATGEATNTLAKLAAVQGGKSLYHDRLFHQPSACVEAVLSASCEVMGFDIAEMWLRTGPKTHQLTNSHLRPTALEDSVRKELVDVYYGEKSSERTHRLSPALCKRAKEANDVVWVTAHTPHGAEALRMSISNVRTAVAVPVCHEASNTNVTIIYFSIRR